MAYWSANTGGGFLSGILGTPSYGIGTYTSTGTSIGSLGQAIPNSGWQQVPTFQQATQFSLPPPSGTISAFSYIDPHTGQTTTIYLDTAYFAILGQIILLQQHYINSPHPQQAPQWARPAPCLPSGEFSLDEMDKAEDIIREIEHDKAA